MPLEVDDMEAVETQFSTPQQSAVTQNLATLSPCQTHVVADAVEVPSVLSTKSKSSAHSGMSRRPINPTWLVTLRDSMLFCVTLNKHPQITHNATEKVIQ